MKQNRFYCKSKLDFDSYQRKANGESSQIDGNFMATQVVTATICTGDKDVLCLGQDLCE